MSPHTVHPVGLQATRTTTPVNRANPEPGAPGLRAARTGKVIEIRGHAEAKVEARATVIVVPAPPPDDPRALAKWLVESCGFRL